MCHREIERLSVAVIVELCPGALGDGQGILITGVSGVGFMENPPPIEELLTNNVEISSDL